jgi:Uma2 family endonuclease
MATVAPTRATLDDLYRTPEKAELIGGRIVPLKSTGHKPGRVVGRVLRSLDDHANQIGIGEAFTSNLAYEVSVLPSGRESFSPDGSYYKGPFPKNPMRFIQGAPSFTVEVRSENDYGPAAELEMAEKRADYFQAGTEAVWDVDTVAECIHVYRTADPDHAVTYRRGSMAEAGPAVPGWSVAVDWIFA